MVLQHRDETPMKIATLLPADGDRQHSLHCGQGGRQEKRPRL